MAREVKLPEIGESVTEGTIIQWLVEEGDHVDEDQPILEISTDKIDTEVPSPAAGVLVEKKVQEDETVEVGQVLAIIGDEDEADAGGDEEDEASAEAEEEAADEAEEEEGDEEQEAAAEAEEEEEEEEEEDADEDQEAAAEAEEEEDADEDEEAAAQADQQEAQAEQAAEDAGGEAEQDERRDRERQPAAQDNGQRADTDGEAREKGQLVSPIVRRMIEEHNLDPSQIEGTGRGGRITREDVEQAIESGGGTQEAEAPAAGRQDGGQAEGGQAGGLPGKVAELAPAARRPAHIEERQRTENLTRIRKSIARHMMESLQTTAQLTATVEVDMTRVIRLRDRVKEEFRQREGVPLTALPFIARAVCLTLPNHEKLNASINLDEGTATFYQFVNLGIAVDTPEGLIVPNVKGADDLTVPGLARSTADLAGRARNRELHPDEIAGGTFTISNTGSRGVLFDTPIINPPQVAILATPRIEKRPIVVESADFGDSIAIRYMNYLCLSYDHRLIDGADAARFLAELKTVLEEHDFTDEVGAGR